MTDPEARARALSEAMIPECVGIYGPDAITGYHGWGVLVAAGFLIGERHQGELSGLRKAARLVCLRQCGEKTDPVYCETSSAWFHTLDQWPSVLCPSGPIHDEIARLEKDRGQAPATLMCAPCNGTGEVQGDSEPEVCTGCNGSGAVV